MIVFDIWTMTSSAWKNKGLPRLSGHGLRCAAPFQQASPYRPMQAAPFPSKEWGDAESRLRLDRLDSSNRNRLFQHAFPSEETGVSRSMRGCFPYSFHRKTEAIHSTKTWPGPTTVYPVILLRYKDLCSLIQYVENTDFEKPLHNFRYIICKY